MLTLRALGTLFTVVVCFVLFACAAPFRLMAWVFTASAEVLFANVVESRARLGRDVAARKAGA